MEPSDKEKEEFIRSYDELADPLFRHCFFKVDSREKAKDLVQETFTRMWQYISSGEKISNQKAFLYKVAGNLIIDYYRKAKVSSLDQMMEKGFDVSFDGDKKTETQSEHSQVLKALQNISDKYRQVVIMRFMDGQTPKEISEILEVSENVVSVRLNRALKQLRNKLKIEDEK